MKTFSEWAWQETEALRQRILELPFNRELANGTLTRERFQFYMIQDAACSAARANRCMASGSGALAAATASAREYCSR